VATLTPPLPARRINVPRLLRLWHLTSLDAVTVAVTWTLFFAWAAHLSLPWWAPAIVGLSAWSFYIADRLLDARRARTPLRPRHRFHWQHRRIFLPLSIACGLAALMLVLFLMPRPVELRDSLVAAAAVAYFAGVHTRAEGIRAIQRRASLFRKELLVALVFTAACAAPALTRSTMRLPLLPLLAIFTALAWLNCHAIESWESGNTQSMQRTAGGLAAASILFACIALLQHYDRISLLLLAATASAGLLALLDRQRERLSSIALRTLADLVLLTPLALTPFLLAGLR
jgi:hypothetical protein